MSEIRGEYWIIDGSVSFADGDISDTNHEIIAIQHVIGNYALDLENLLDELDLTGYKLEGYEGIDWEECNRALSDIVDNLTEKMTEKQAYEYIKQYLQCNNDALQILMGNGDAKFYCIVYDRWIAVRDNNAELYGWDQENKHNLAEGIEEILWEEGQHKINPEEIDIAIYDHKSQRSFYMTLAELKAPEQVVRSNIPATSTYNRTFVSKDREENKYSVPSLSKPNQWTTAARQAGIIGPGQDLWRNTSESRLSFSEWLKRYK